MKLRKCGLLVLLVAAILSALCMTACSKRPADSAPEPTYDVTLDSVPQDSIVFVIDGNALNASWSAVENAMTYEIKIGDFTFTTDKTTVDLKSVEGLTLPTGNFDFTITAKADGYNPSAPTTKTFSAGEAEELTDTFELRSLENSVLRWKTLKGAGGYRVVDIDYNVTVVTGTEYDMFDKNIVLGVYPIIENEKFDITAVNALDIKYLQGSGTQDDPYLIKTPFDLRAVDYYEARYFNEKKQTRNYYKIANDIDYSTVNALESVSNLYTLHKPFFGTLDGDGKKLSNVYVNYDGGYWALFDFLTVGSAVKNIVFDSPEINNALQVKDVPINASIATIAYRNYGAVSAITVKNAKYTATGGEVSGIVSHNYGTVENCEVSGTFKQGSTGQQGQACYEMAGVVLENCKGGKVTGNKVPSLVISGSQCKGDNGPNDLYNNVRSAGGIVSVNRAGGIVSGNSYTSLNMTMMLNWYNEAAAPEWGGIVAYNASGATVSGNTAGTFTWNGSSITRNIGTVTDPIDHRGRIVGKNDASSAS